jgi:drug/metabolite transporter (DMT)-like permease
VRKSIFLAVTLAAIANFFWAANAIVGKYAVASLPAFSLSLFRWLAALCLLLPFGLPVLIKQRAWYRAHWRRLTFLAILSVTLYNTLQYWALEYAQAITIGSMLALMPVAISIVSWLFGGRRLSALEWLTTLIAMFGALLVITDGDFSTLMHSGGQGLGFLLMSVAITCWALYSVYLKRLPHDTVHPLGMLMFFVLIGSLFIVPFWCVDLIHGKAKLPPLNLWWAVGFVAFFPSIISYICWNQAIRLSDATIAGLMVTTAPLFNALLSMIFLETDISQMQWAGIAIVISGVIVTLLLTRKLAKEN